MPGRYASIETGSDPWEVRGKQTSSPHALRTDTRWRSAAVVFSVSPCGVGHFTSRCASLPTSTVLMGYQFWRKYSLELNLSTDKAKIWVEGRRIIGRVN